MSDQAAGRRARSRLAAGLIFFTPIAMPVLGAGVGGYSSSIGGSGGAVPGSSVIRHGSTGFSIYSPRGVTRVIGGPPQRTRIPLLDGRSGHLVGDGRGGAWLLGAPGNYWIPDAGAYHRSNTRRLAGDGR